MGTFYEDMIAELIDVIYDADNDMSELITVKFNDDETEDKPIQAVVERPAASRAGLTSSPRPILHIVADSAHGLTYDELDVGQMTFLVSERHGQPTSEWAAKLLDTSSKAELILELL